MRSFFITVLLFISFQSFSQQPAVIAYYAGRASQVDSFAAEKFTHIIFSFCHLKGNRLTVDRMNDTITIQNLVGLKKRNPNLKVLLSLGGWGGCMTCSSVFSTKAARKEFAESVRELSDYFQTDGLDLDWEYPAIEGYPGHQYMVEDRKNFTSLVTVIRKKIGKGRLISFAAGGFGKAIDSSFEWKKVMKKADFVNLMSYDLTSGFSKVSGHHTPLYSTPTQKESLNNGVMMMIAAGVPPGKIVIGAAFYARIFQTTDTTANGINRDAAFYKGIPYRMFEDSLWAGKTYSRFWDDVAQAPYAFNATEKLFVTYDDARSIEAKTLYAIKHKLKGIMFWQLTDDSYDNGLLHAIDVAKAKAGNSQ